MKKNRIIAAVLSMVLTFSLVGCAGGGKAVSSFKTNGSELTLWYEPSTVKIIQNDEGKAVKTAKKKDVLKISMARNEAEGVQLMMYAKEDIASYKVSVSDLVSEDGIIPASDIDIYQMKYMELKGNQVLSNPDFTSGMLPDPLLPFETAVEYKEDVIEKGNNQSIYFDVETNESTPSGLYQGVVTVKTDKDTYQMPLEVTVHDVTYAATPGLQTAFPVFARDHIASAELDASDEQMTAYYETLLEYNMSSALPYEGTGGLEAYLGLLKKYYDYDGFNSYRIFYAPDKGGYDGVGAKYNIELLKEYVLAIAEMSVEEQKDYLDKAYFQGYTIVDEPRTEQMFLDAKEVIDQFQKLKEDIDTEMRAKYAGTEQYEFYDTQLSESVLDIPWLLPGYFDMDSVRQYGIEEMTLVILTENLHTEADRKYFTEGREDKELWAYSCNGPIYPYASGHIDDYSVGFRLTSWMAFDYDWAGYLYWGVADYLYQEHGHVIDDPWTNMDTGQRRPGEGRFFYPGEKYGLDTPCPSIRAMAYRDGTEDYELLTAVQKIYESYGMDADSALQSIYDSVYTGVIPITDSYLFEDVRNQLFEMIADLKSDVGVLYKENVIAFDEAVLTFRTVNEKAKVKIDGKTLKADKDGFYQVKADLTKQSKLTIEVSYGDVTKKYTHVLQNGIVGVAESFEKAEDLSTYFTSMSAGYEATINKDTTLVSEGKQSVHMQINKNGEDTLPYFAVQKDSKLIGGSWENLKSIKVSIYNAGEKEVSLDVSYYTTEDNTLGIYNLTAGKWTEIEVQMPIDSSETEFMEEIDFNFNKGDIIDIYIDGFTTILAEE